MNANTGYKHDTDFNLCVSGPKKKIFVSDCMVFKIRVGRSGFFYPLTNEVAKGYSIASVRPSHPCEHSRINILQWILTNLGT